MSASRKRETKETSIEVILEIEGSGIIQIDTGIELMDAILSAMARGAGSLHEFGVTHGDDGKGVCEVI